MWHHLLFLGPAFLLAPAWGQGDEDYSEEVASTHMPHILSTPSTFNVEEGETVKFPCDIDDIGTFVRLWKKGKSQVLFAGGVALIRDRRFTILNETELQIKSVRASDAGEYICQISTSIPLEISHTLDILIPPEVQPEPKDGHVIVKAGEPVSIGCKASGHPKPSIVWKALEGMLPTNNKAELGEVIQISEVDRNHAGVFECTASNDVGDPKSAIIQVKVLYPPEVEASSTWVHAGEGTTVEISCTVHAEPSAVVVWNFQNGGMIHASNQIRLKTVGNTHNLQIRKMTLDDFTTYVCKANNSLGISSKAIEVSGLAAPVTFKSNPNGKRQTSFLLMWSVKSYNPVLEYLLKIRKKMDNDTNGTYWSEVIIPADHQPGLIWTQTYNITGLEYATTYEAVMQARNDFGINQPSEMYMFSTEGKVIFMPTVPEEVQSFATDEEHPFHTKAFEPIPEEMEEENETAPVEDDDDDGDGEEKEHDNNASCSLISSKLRHIPHLLIIFVSLFFS